MARVSLPKVSSEQTPSSSYISLVMRVYIVLEKNWKSHTWKSNRQCVLWVTCDLAWVTNHLWNLSYEGLFKFKHVLLTWFVSWSEVKSKSWASCENLLFTNSSPKSHAQPLHKIPQKYREMMKQNYNQIWHIIKANIYVVVVFFIFLLFFLETTYIYSCKSQI